MRQSTITQMRLLVLFLLKLRSDADGYAKNLKFGIDDITLEETEDKLGTLEALLTELKDDNEIEEIIQSPHTAIKGFDIANPNDITVEGSTTIKLLAYASKRLGAGKGIFGHGRNAAGQMIIKVLGEETEVRIDLPSSAVFSCLLNHFGEKVPCDVLFSKLRESYRRDNAAFWGSYENNPSRKLRYVNEQVRTVRKTLNEALQELLPGTDKLDVIRNERYKGRGSEGGVYTLFV